MLLRVKAGPKRVFFGYFAGVLGLFLGLSGCWVASPVTGSGSDACDAVPSDQRGSFLATLSSFPVTITADASFTAEQQQGLAYAVSQWNAIGQRSLREDLFVLNFAPIPGSIAGVDPGDCHVEYGESQDFYLIREKSSAHWSKIGLSKVVPGATFRCDQGSQILRQIVFIFPEVVDSSQFSSVALHELGHTIGLDHSCLAQAAGRVDFRLCPDLEVGHPYRQAVMYPWLHVPSGKRGILEVKDSLQTNDRVRASCALGSL